MVNLRHELTFTNIFGYNVNPAGSNKGLDYPYFMQDHILTVVKIGRNFCSVLQSLENMIPVLSINGILEW